MLGSILSMITTFSKFLIPILEILISVDFLLIIRNPFYPKKKRTKYYYFLIIIYSILIIYQIWGINEFEDKDQTMLS